MHNVVITGLGIVSPAGVGKTEFWANLLASKGNFQNADFPGIDMKKFKSNLISKVNSFDFETYFPKFKNEQHISKSTKFSLVATKLALADAGVAIQQTADEYDKYAFTAIDSCRTSVILGVGGVNADLLEFSLDNFFRDKSPGSMTRFSVSNVSNASVSGYISNTFSVHGTNFVVSCACSSANLAIMQSAMRIKLGFDDMVITGGTDAMTTLASFAAFDKMGALATKFAGEPDKAYRPFDKDRSGMILSEGSGIIILESLEHAQRRNAFIYGELTGFGSTSDGLHIYRPDTEGKYVAEAMKLAINNAGLNLGDIDHINAHGSSTLINDSLESRAIREVFGEKADTIPVTANKSVTGHSIGACGAFEACSTILSINTSKIPPVANLENPDIAAGCNLFYVRDTPLACSVRHAISNSFGFGGINSTLVFSNMNAG